MHVLRDDVSSRAYAEFDYCLQVGGRWSVFGFVLMWAALGSGMNAAMSDVGEIGRWKTSHVAAFRVSYKGWHGIQGGIFAVVLSWGGKRPNK